MYKKVFAIDVLACPDCNGRLKMIAFIAEQGTARKILEHLEVMRRDRPWPPRGGSRSPSAEGAP